VPDTMTRASESAAGDTAGGLRPLPTRHPARRSRWPFAGRTGLVNLWPASRLDELMPWAWAAERSAHKLAA
jgi:hypothetical protein